MTAVGSTVEEQADRAYHDALLRRSFGRLERVGLDSIVWLALVPTWTERLATAAGFPTARRASVADFVARAEAEGYCASERTAPAGDAAERELRALAALGPYLPAQLLERALELVAQGPADSLRTRALAGAARAFDARQLEQAARLAALIRAPASRAAALAALAAVQPDVILPAAIEAARDVPNPVRRAQLLTGLVPLGVPAADALAEASAIPDATDRAAAWSELAPHLDAAQRTSILARAAEVEDVAARVHLAVRLGALEEAEKVAAADPAAQLDVAEAYAAAGDAEHALEASTGILDEDAEARILGFAARDALRDHDPVAADAALHQAVIVCRTVRTLVGVAQLVREAGDRERAAHVAGEAARRARELPPNAASLRDLQPVVRLHSELRTPEADPLGRQALGIARAIPDDRDRADALTQLVPALPEDLREEAAREAADAVGRLADAQDRAALLASLAPHLDPQTRASAIEATVQLARSGPEGLSFWMPGSVRDELLDLFTDRRYTAIELDLRREAGRVASAIASAQRKQGVPVPPAVQRWVDLASQIGTRSGLSRAARWFDAQVARALVEGDVARALDWIETGTALADAVGDELAGIVRYANRRLELIYRQVQDERALQRFLLRDEQEEAFERLMAGESGWALHYIGVGGVGKTMLLRHLAKIAADRGVATARVDFDYLTADYPTRRPGQLLLELMADLGTYASSDRHEAQIESFRDSVVRLHETTAEGSLENPLAAIRSTHFESVLRAFRDFLRLLERPVVLVLDTCEELAKYQPAGYPVPSVEATFEVIERIRGDGSGPDVRVVFAGRRPLARSGGTGEWAWSVGDDDAESRALLSVAKDYLAVHEIRGFTRDEAHGFLTGIMKLDLPADVEGAILEGSPDTGRVRALRQAHPPLEETRYSPFDLAFHAEWAREARPRSVAEIESAGADLYVERRIIQRVEHDLELLLPGVVLLRRFDERLLRPVFAGGDASFRGAFRKLRDQEWISMSRDTGDGPTFLQLDVNLRPRLLAYYDRPARRGTLDAARRRLAAVVEARIDGSDLGDVPVELVDSALGILPADVGCALWQRVALRVAADGRWDWARQVAGRLLAEDGSVPAGHPARASVRAAFAAALIHSAAPEYPDSSWDECAASVDREPDPAVRQWLAARVRAGHAVAAVQRGEGAPLAEVLDSFPGSRHADERVARAMTEQLAASTLAAVEASVEAEEPVDVDVLWHWLRRLDDEAVSPTLRGFARVLAARALGGPRAGQLLQEAEHVLQEAEGTAADRWLDWVAPASVRCRARLEHWRASTLEAGLYLDPEVVAEWTVDAEAGADTIDGERLLSAILQTRLGRAPIPAAELQERETAATYDAERHPRCSAHRAAGPLFAALARGWLALGEPARALALLEAHLSAATSSGVDAAQTVRSAERGKLEVIRRMRLLATEPLLVTRMLQSSSPADVDLAAACVALAGGYEVPEELPWRWSSGPPDDEPSDPLDHAEWLLVTRGERQRPVPLWSWTRERPATVEDAVRRDLRAATLGVLEDVEVTAIGAWTTILGTAERRLGPRRLAELALEEGEALALRLPAPAVVLLEVAALRFDDAGDPVGALIARTRAVLARAHAELQLARPDSRKELQEAYRAAALPGRPSWDSLGETGRDPARIEQLLDADPDWGPWLLRVNAALVWCAEGQGPPVAPERIARPPLELTLGAPGDARQVPMARAAGLLKGSVRLLQPLGSGLLTLAFVVWLLYQIVNNPTGTAAIIAGSVVVGMFAIVGLILLVERFRKQAQAARLLATTLRLVVEGSGGGEAWPKALVALRLSERRPGDADLGTPSLRSAVDVTTHIALRVLGFRRSLGPVATFDAEWATPPIGPYGAAGGPAGTLPEELRGLRRALRGTVSLPLECPPDLAGLPWEAFLSRWTQPDAEPAGSLGVYRRAEPLPGSPRRLVEPGGSVQVVTERTWAPLASGAWGDRAAVTDSFVSVGEAGVLHVIGRPVGSSRGTLFQIAGTGARLRADLAESVRGTGSLLRPEQIAGLAPVVVVQAEPAEVLVRVDSDREEAAKVRVFAAETLAAGARLVVAVPSLTPALAEEALAVLAGALRGRSPAVTRIQAGLGFRPDRDVVRVLRAVEDMRGAIRDRSGPDDEGFAELALDVCVFARHDLPDL